MNCDVSLMAMRFTLLPLTLMIASALMAQEAYFPKGAFSDREQSDSFLARWYSSQLKALEEPSLIEAAKDPAQRAYRFTWLRTFHHPLAVRLEVMPDGTGRLTVKTGSGAGGYDPGKVIENKTLTLTRQQTERFLTTVEKVQFWSLATHDDVSGCDGSEWIIEGVNDGKYHVVNRWTPGKGPVFKLGKTLAFDLAHVTIPKEEIY